MGSRAETPAIVCGLGPSLFEYVHRHGRPEGVLYGCNGIDAFIHPDVLVLVDGWLLFPPDERAIAEKTKAKEVFYRGRGWGRNLPAGTKKSHIMLRNWNDGWNLYKESCLPFSDTTAFVCAGLAARRGHKRIYLLGVDIHGHPVLEGKYKKVDEAFGSLAKVLREQGDTEMFNLSSHSLLKSVQYAESIETEVMSHG